MRSKVLWKNQVLRTELTICVLTSLIFLEKKSIAYKEKRICPSNPIRDLRDGVTKLDCPAR